MKGITHFTIGVAAASCFPPAVQAASNGNPLYFILGGAMGLLPDTIDFKIYRFFYRHDAEITPDPLAPDPQMIADAVAAAIDIAAERNSPFRIRLNTIRLAPDLWQRYSLKLHPQTRNLEISLQEKIDTSKTPVAAPPETNNHASADFKPKIKLDYLATTNIDIFEGPIFQMTPTPNGQVTPLFIPWHRSWSHSFITAMLIAIPLGLCWNWIASAIAMLAYSAHILCDQLGFLGSNLFWPISRYRTTGLKKQHSGNAFANFYSIWIACLLILWNISFSVTIDHSKLFTLITWATIAPLAARQIYRTISTLSPRKKT